MQVPAIWFTAVAAVLALSACGAPSTIASTASSPSSAASGSPAAAATDACPTQLTPAQTEGPYFKPGSPPRTSLIESGMTGTRLLLSGRVLTLACAPVAGVTLDFWQADAGGTYDNSGYRLRGHQTVGADGTFRLETVIPGLYPGRTEHIHVKVQAPGKPVLTTQLFFPGVASNAGDSIFDPALLITLTDSGDGGKAGAYDFYVAG